MTMWTRFGTPDRDDTRVLAGKPEEEAGSRSLAGQILEMLGEECEVDSRFFEDSWTYGLQATVARAPLRPGA